MVEMEQLTVIAIGLIIATIVLSIGQDVLQTVDMSMREEASTTLEEHNFVAGTEGALTHNGVSAGMTLDIQNQTVLVNTTTVTGVGSNGSAIIYLPAWASTRQANISVAADINATETVNVSVNGHLLGTLSGPVDTWIGEESLLVVGANTFAFNNSGVDDDSNITSLTINYQYWQPYANTEYTLDSLWGGVTVNHTDAFAANYTYSATNTASNSTEYGMEGINKVAGWIPTIALVIAAAIVIGLVMRIRQE